MAKFSEGQRVRVPATSTSAPKALRDQEGVVTSLVFPPAPADFMAAHAMEDQAEQKYKVKFDFDEKTREFGEAQIEPA